MDPSHVLQLCVLSGKGGTGKTTVTASLAALAPQPLVLADADVDAANLHLALAARELSHWPFECGVLAHIEDSACNACGACLAACRFGAVVAEGDRFRVDPLRCEGCGVCAIECDADAIAFSTRRSGELYTSRTAFGELVHARLLPGRESSGKLVAAVREAALAAAASVGAERVLIDGPPGIGCPVIAALSGVDLALLVAEPSVAGLQGMDRALQVAEHFGIPAVACLNRTGLDPQRDRALERHLAERGVELLARIPFDPEVVAANADLHLALRAASPAVRRELERLGTAVFERLGAAGAGMARRTS